MGDRVQIKCNEDTFQKFSEKFKELADQIQKELITFRVTDPIAIGYIESNTIFFEGQYKVKVTKESS